MYALSTTLFVLMIVSHLIVGELSSKFMSLPNVYLKCIYIAHGVILSFVTVSADLLN